MVDQWREKGRHRKSNQGVEKKVPGAKFWPDKRREIFAVAARGGISLARRLRRKVPA
jgi:hypothetical protein